MSKTVHKHCSILNYIRHADEELSELIQDLCIGRIFVPRKGAPGLTFLRPDKQLLEQIKKQATGDNPEDAVASIQSLVLLDNLAAPSDFEDKKSDIPTFLRKKLPVARADGKKVTLKNGAEIVLDKDFDKRNDRSNISVYIISKALVPADTEPATFANAKVAGRKVRGGGDYMGGRAILFERVMAECATVSKADRDPALEVLVALLRWTEKNNKLDLHKAICSQLSDDTLASLAIVLQPYRDVDDADPTKYVKDSDYNAWALAYNNNNTALYCYCADPVKYYMGKMADHDCASTIKKHRDELSNDVAKLNIVKNTMSQYAKLANDLNGNVDMPPARKAVLANPKVAMAEAELRVYSALLRESSQGMCDHNEMMTLFKVKCNLKQPYMCTDKDAISVSNVGFYYSTIYLLVRSDAWFYVPGVGGSVGLDGVASDDTVELNKDMKLAGSLDSKYNEKQDAIKAILGLSEL